MNLYEYVLSTESDHLSDEMEIEADSIEEARDLIEADMRGGDYTYIMRIEEVLHNEPERIACDYSHLIRLELL